MARSPRSTAVCTLVLLGCMLLVCRFYPFLEIYPFILLNAIGVCTMYIFYVIFCVMKKPLPIRMDLSLLKRIEAVRVAVSGPIETRTSWVEGACYARVLKEEGEQRDRG